MKFLLKWRWFRNRFYKKNLIARLKDSLKSASPYSTQIHMSTLIYKEFMRINKEATFEGKEVIECRANIPGSWDFR